MKLPSLITLWAALACCTQPSLVHAVQVCELDGQSVSPSNGNTTAGKTGLMRCRDGADGPVVREQELRQGVFMGVVRYFKEGVLEREFHTNERGNRDGLSREYAGSRLVSEETYRNGSTVGQARRWDATGQLRRVSFHADDGREVAQASFTAQGKLNELRCDVEPRLRPHADDAAWCGHEGGPRRVTLHADNGAVLGSLEHERGTLRRSEQLWSNGKPRLQLEYSNDGGCERSFFESGTPRRERQWAGAGSRRETTLEREYHESGSLTRERRWKPGERGSELVVDQRWYLNGQAREKLETTRVDGRPAVREINYHDNGRIAAEGVWIQQGRYNRQPTGVHARYDTEGRLRSETHHDEKGRVTRERLIDESGQVTRDDEVFEDGSRKAYSVR